MVRFLLVIIFVLGFQTSRAQLYFPPVGSTTWDTLSPSSLGWCQQKIDSLYQFLDNQHTKSFIVLKNGKIVLEKYFDTQTASSFWYWASAGKTLTAFLVGIAQENNFLKIQDTTSNYLGYGWTSLAPSDEQKITIKHQLSMTTGLDDAVTDPYCTLSNCLLYKATPGTRWAYHNAPYSLLDSVIEIATGQSMMSFVNQKIKAPTGMDGFFVNSGYNHVFYSTARSMARFGLLLLNKGKWDNTSVLSDTTYFHQMTHSSQSINPSYGYLTWLNGQSSFMVPQSQLSFPGTLNPHGPADLFAALGKNAQFINVAPSQGLVWIRMGDAPDSNLVPFLLNDSIWMYLNELSCAPASVDATLASDVFQVYPNPATDYIQCNIPDESQVGSYQIRMYDLLGKLVKSSILTHLNDRIDVKNLPVGSYVMQVKTATHCYTSRWHKSAR